MGVVGEVEKGQKVKKMICFSKGNTVPEVSCHSRLGLVCDWRLNDYTASCTLSSLLQEERRVSPTPCLHVCLLFLSPVVSEIWNFS